MNSDTADAARVSKVIFEYAGRIGQEQDLDQLLHLTAALARDLVASDRCSIWLVDKESGDLWTKVAHGVDEIRVPAGTGIVGKCVSTGEAILVNDTSSDPRFSGDADKRSGYRTESVLAVPLRTSHGQVIGACQVLNKPGGFELRDVDLIWLAASYSATAIETHRALKEAALARKLQAEIEVARQVQHNLFPKYQPNADGLDLATSCIPAQAVGGDYFNYWQSTEGVFHFAIGDVSGKGIAAALLMASIQATLNGLFARGDLPLEKVMSELSRLVLANSMPEQYTTLVLGEYRSAERAISLVNAGHVSPLLIHANEPIVFSEGGLPAGLLPDAHYKKSCCSVVPGDLLVCVSDGISEAMNWNYQQWGESAIADVAVSSSMQAHSAATVSERLVRGAKEFAGGAPQSDDMTVMILRFT